MNRITTDSAVLLGDNGPFKALLPDFQPRENQLQMAQCVDQAIDGQQHIAVEAPSGSGKTFAYLVPVVNSEQRVVLSTATHYLQQQLYRQDLPVVQRVLGSNKRVSVLKGRLNYLCPYFLEKALHNRKLSLSERGQLQLVTERFSATANGNLDALTADIDRSLLPQMTASAEECLGNSCPKAQQCPWLKARLAAKQADILIVNHHVMFSDILDDEHWLNVNVVVDEAHRLLDVGHNLAGEHLSSFQLNRFITALMRAIKSDAPEYAVVIDYLQRFSDLINQWVMPFSVQDRWQRLSDEVIDTLLARIRQLHLWLQQHKERAASLSGLSIQSAVLLGKLERVEHNRSLGWVEPRRKGFVIHCVPETLSAILQRHWTNHPGAWIFTSATLSLAGNYQPLQHLLGIDSLACTSLPANIDYRQRAKLYTPSLTVLPDNFAYAEQLALSISELLAVVPGRALLLFNSHAMLQQVASQLDNLAGRQVLIQGDELNVRLVDAFKNDAQSVLLGTGSFWEGLDLAGAPLSCVVIDKLPFASPVDPIVEIRSQYQARSGVDPFQSVLLPDAVLKLRQGCGRLLRRLQDKGVIMLADPRLDKKDYGTVFLQSLPPMDRCYDLQSVADFFTVEDLSTAEDSVDETVSHR
jgi:ATP-dependent DNA helicase DinG